MTRLEQAEHREKLQEHYARLLVTVDGIVRQSEDGMYTSDMLALMLYPLVQEGKELADKYAARLQSDTDLISGMVKDWEELTGLQPAGKEESGGQE